MTNLSRMTLKILRRRHPRRPRVRLNGILPKCAPQSSGCCFVDHDVEETTYCGGKIPHRFCLGCARQYAEIEIGNGKYDLWNSISNQNKFKMYPRIRVPGTF